MRTDGELIHLGAAEREGRPLTACGSTLRAIRERRGFTATYVADEMGRSTSYVSKAEYGEIAVEGADLAAFARALDVDERLLLVELPQEPPEGVHFRCHKISKRTRDRLVSHANFVSWTLNALFAELDVEQKLPRTIPEIDIDTLLGGEAEAANLVRAHWRLWGPVKNVSQLLESAGVFIAPMPRGVEGVDALTVRTTGPVVAVVLLAENMPEDRKRHTLAHELGHMVMDAASGIAMSVKDIEHRADRFAGEFLAPYAELRDDLRGITPSQIDVLEGLRRTWGVSLSALVRRARLAEDITESQYRYWFRHLNAAGKLRGELGSSYPVRPRALGDFLDHVRRSGYSEEDIRQVTCTSSQELSEVFGQHWPFKRPRPALRVLPALV